MTKKFACAKIPAYKKKEIEMIVRNEGEKIKGEKIIKKVCIKADRNSDIDHLLITEKNNIFAITVAGKRYWNIKSEGLTKEDIEARYGISLDL